MGELLFILVLSIVAIGYLTLVISQNQEKESRLRNARFRYTENLRKLSLHPANAEQRRRTLAAGRIYSQLTREDKKVTLFDEMALNNDLMAASGGTAVSDVPSAPKKDDSFEAPKQEPDDEISRLERIARLHDQGALSDEEFRKAKSIILGFESEEITPVESEPTITEPIEAESDDSKADLREQAKNVRRAYKEVQGDDDDAIEQRKRLAGLYAELDRRIGED